MSRQSSDPTSPCRTFSLSERTRMSCVRPMLEAECPVACIANEW